MMEPPPNYQHENYETWVHRANKDACSIKVQKGGRTRSLVANWEKRERSPTYEGYTSSNFSRDCFCI